MAQLPDWHKMARKSLPYIMVVVLTCGILLTFLGVKNPALLTQMGKLLDWDVVSYAGVADTKAELEAEKQAMLQKQLELELAMRDTESLLTQLNTIKQETQDILSEAAQEGVIVTEKLEKLKETLESIELKQQQRWVMPIQNAQLTSPYGYRSHPVVGEVIFHAGVDLAAPLRTPIVAARGGTVVKADYQKDGAGYYVVIDHLDGYKSTYMHMNRYKVEVGQVVFAGQVIGECGQTGVATGPHLHFEISKDDKVVNPSDYIDIP